MRALFVLAGLVLVGCPALAQRTERPGYFELSRYLWDIELAGIAADCDLWPDPLEGPKVEEAIAVLMGRLSGDWGATLAMGVMIRNASAMQDRLMERTRLEREGAADTRPPVCMRRDWDAIRARFEIYRAGGNPHR
jgi:hypothetical protein